MSTLTVTAKGQVTLRRDLLKHLGVQPGEKIIVDKLPDGRIEMKGLAADGQHFGCLRFFEAGERPVLVDRRNQRGREAGLGRQAMKITADTDVLVRAITGDDERQSKLAQAELAKAEAIALALPALCELVWVLSQVYKVSAADIGEAIRRLTNAANVLVNRPAAEAGLAMLDAGSDFADGVISYEGSWLGAETFVSFDKEATKLLAMQGRPVRLLS
jgi:predicted nucleic-acid-binding protein